MPEPPQAVKASRNRDAKGMIKSYCLLTKVEVSTRAVVAYPEKYVHLDNANHFVTVFLRETQGPSTSSCSTVPTMNHDKTPLVYPVRIIKIIIPLLSVQIDKSTFYTRKRGCTNY